MDSIYNLLVANGPYDGLLFLFNQTLFSQKKYNTIYPSLLPATSAIQYWVRYFALLIPVCSNDLQENPIDTETKNLQQNCQLERISPFEEETSLNNSFGTFDFVQEFELSKSQEDKLGL